jgi:hypothetical protein
LPDDDQELVSDLQTRRTPPSSLPTDAEFRQSELLSSMREEAAVRVLLDDSASDQDEDFVWSYFGRLGETWLQSEDVDVERVAREDVDAFLEQEPNAVYVGPSALAAAPPTATRTSTPGPGPTVTPPASTPLGALPFYIASDGVDWSVMFPADRAAVSAFGRFTEATLSTGDYFNMYFPIFDSAPPYDVLLGLLADR